MIYRIELGSVLAVFWVDRWSTRCPGASSALRRRDESNAVVRAPHRVHARGVYRQRNGDRTGEFQNGATALAVVRTDSYGCAADILSSREIRTTLWPINRLREGVERSA